MLNHIVDFGSLLLVDINYNRERSEAIKLMQEIYWKREFLNE